MSRHLEEVGILIPTSTSNTWESREALSTWRVISACIHRVGIIRLSSIAKGLHFRIQGFLIRFVPLFTLTLALSLASPALLKLARVMLLQTIVCLINAIIISSSRHRSIK